MATGATLPVAANVVAEAFVKQYYTVLHSCPENAHRFYTDASRLTRAEAGPDGVVDTVTAQNEIHNKMVSQDYLNLKAEIRTIDSLESLNGGVLVMVTGSLSKKVEDKRNFVQSFFLAPQERGFFVLNDIFRYLDEEYEPSKPSGAVVPAVQDAVETLETTSSVNSEAEEVAILSVAPVSVASVESPEFLVAGGQELTVSEVQDTDTRTDEPLEEAFPPEDVAVSEEAGNSFAESVIPFSEEVQEPTPKKSYASILRHMKESSGSQATTPVANVVPKSASVNLDRASASVQAASLPSNVAGAREDIQNESPDLDHEGDGRSIYIKNLPMNITAHELHEEFKRFGPIKPNAINVRSQKQQGFCYAFVEFEDTNAAQNAIDASPLTIGGRQAHIQEKRPATSHAMGSRSSSGRGDRSFRPDGGRGRAYFGGRGQGRPTGQDRERDPYFRGRGSGAMRGTYNGSYNVNAVAKMSSPKT